MKGRTRIATLMEDAPSDKAMTAGVVDLPKLEGRIGAQYSRTASFVGYFVCTLAYKKLKLPHVEKCFSARAEG